MTLILTHTAAVLLALAAGYALGALMRQAGEDSRFEEAVEREAEMMKGEREDAA